MATTPQDTDTIHAKSTKRKQTRKVVQQEELFFHTLAEALACEYENVSWGKMMSSPGVRYQDKFFAFYYNNGIVCRFGRDFQPESIGIHEYTLLSPFKSESKRAPLRDWFCIDQRYQDRWEESLRTALKIMAGDSLTPSSPPSA